MVQTSSPHLHDPHNLCPEVRVTVSPGAPIRVTARAHELLHLRAGEYAPRFGPSVRGSSRTGGPAGKTPHTCDPETLPLCVRSKGNRQSRGPSRQGGKRNTVGGGSWMRTLAGHPPKTPDARRRRAAAGAASQPASEPASQPASQAAVQPASQPTSQPASSRGQGRRGQGRRSEAGRSGVGGGGGPRAADLDLGAGSGRADIGGLKLGGRTWPG